MSLDGYIAPESRGGLMGRQWMELQAWTAPRVTHLTYAVRKR